MIGTAILLILLIVAIFVVLPVIVLLIVFLLIPNIKKKQKLFVENTSTRINELKCVNEEYKNEFGSVQSCNLTLVNTFKYLRTYEHFCGDKNKVTNYALDYASEVVDRTRKVLINSLVDISYQQALLKINATPVSTIKMKHFLSKEKYLEIENALFKEIQFKVSKTFDLILVAQYISEKGYNTHKVVFRFNFGWIREAYKQIKHADIIEQATTNLSDIKKYGDFIKQLESIKVEVNSKNCDFIMWYKPYFDSVFRQKIF